MQQKQLVAHRLNFQLFQLFAVWNVLLVQSVLQVLSLLQSEISRSRFSPQHGRLVAGEDPKLWLTSTVDGSKLTPNQNGPKPYLCPWRWTPLEEERRNRWERSERPEGRDTTWTRGKRGLNAMFIEMRHATLSASILCPDLGNNIAKFHFGFCFCLFIWACHWPDTKWKNLTSVMSGDLTLRLG